MAAMHTQKLLALLLICSSLHIGYSQTDETTTIDNIDEEVTLDTTTLDTTTEDIATTADPCDSLNCGSDGECDRFDNGTAYCSCDDNYAGAACETFVDPCGPVDCNDGSCSVTGEGTFECICTDDCEGDYCEDCGPPDVIAAFEIQMTVATLDEAAASFTSNYNTATSADYLALQTKVCNFLINTVYKSSWVSVDCVLSDVDSDMVVTVDTIVGSTSSITVSDFEDEISDNASEDDTNITIDDSEDIEITKDSVLQCPTCFVAIVYGNGMDPMVGDGEIDCVTGENIDSEPCYQVASSGREHQCAVVEYIEDGFMGTNGLVRAVGRDCVAASTVSGELLASKAVTFAENEVDLDSVESNITALVTDTFVRVHLCDSDDCLTDFEPCLDPMQAQCYNSSKCIGLDQFCDQRSDCPEGEDESIELCGVPPACSGPTDFRCTNETGTCIQQSQLCDLIVDCDNLVDEADCNGTCLRPSSPSNGYIVDPRPVYQNDSYVTYACNDGYTLENEQQLCLEESITGSAPACIRNCREPSLADDIITLEFNGTFDNGARYPHDGVVALKCTAGYSLDPSDDVNIFTCDEGDWAETGTNTPSGFRCKNIDECDSDPCGNNTSCVDSVGSYSCNCMTGYAKPNAQADYCDDINECTAGSPCHANADCTNTEGSYTCACSDGYEGDGITNCQKALFFDYYNTDFDYSLRQDKDDTVYNLRYEYVSEYIEPPAGFPFGSSLFNYIYFTPDGLIVLQENFAWWKSSYPYPFGAELSNSDPAAVIAPFWTKTDFKKGGDIYYQTYYRLTETPSDAADVLDDMSERIAEANSTYTSFNATWALLITYDAVPEVTSAADTENTNTYQCVLITDGLYSFIFFIYKNSMMKWDALEQQNAVIGFNNPFDTDVDPVNLHSSMSDKYMPDMETGNTETGRDGYYFYRLDTNSADYINPNAFCEEWAAEQPSGSANLASRISPCPCSAAQADADGRYTTCERYSSDLANFNEPAADEVSCYQHNWANSINVDGDQYKAGGRCTYDSTGALISGYRDVWANSNAQLFHGSLGGSFYDASLATKDQWKDNEVKARYYCCKKGTKCDLYETKRPAMSCTGYQQVQPGFFYGDPHIKTLDGGDTYSFNGLGEYTMVAIDTMDFELQGRAAFAMVNGTIQENGGTVFVAFAAKLGKTTIEFILNDNRTAFLTVVNGTEVVDADALAAGDSYLNSDDTSLTIDYTTSNNSNDRIAARWRTTMPDDDETGVDFTVSLAVQLAMLDIVIEVPPEIKDLAITEGLMGVYDGNLTNDYMFPNATLMVPANENFTEREIFDFGETWRTDSSSSLFSYSQEGGDWDDYNDEDYVPPFLDELIENADADFLAEVYALCGMTNTECLYDSLATNSTAIGGSTAATGSAITSQLASLNNFPPNITGITETSGTDALQSGNLLRLEVDETYTFQIAAEDPNGDSISYALVYSDLGASISNSGVLTVAPTTTDDAQLEVSLSDGTANTSVVFKLQLCFCDNSGECNWDAAASDGFDVATCICTAGWTGDNCSIDLDSCVENPCYPGVQCIDQAPPEVNATCGDCPSGLLGDGFSCYDFDECSDSVANDCNQTCTNNLGSYACSCGSGYELAIDNKGCDDVDECLEGTDTCDNNATCTNNYGSFTCPCQSGYEKDASDMCMDINECLAYPCANIATCINYAGGHTCLCPSGYYGDGTTCTDIDECLGSDTNDCHAQATCRNLEGSYECTCNSGYEGSGTSCDDVNECSTGTAACHSRADCTNTVGSYLCSCQAGFIGTGLTCTDIDECSLGIDDCSQSCVNTAPDYECACNTGFELDGDGTSCSVASGSECSDNTKTCGSVGNCAVNSDGDDTCYCDRGASLDGDTCTDDDECTAGTDECDDDNGSCTNASPGYTCSCVSGYALDNDERTCTDIDECATSTDSCDAQASCTNTIGGYNCTCNTGYEGNGTTCTNVNECLTSPCHANGACTDTDGSYTCACSTGFQGDGYSVCVDLNECNNVGVCDTQATCNNTDGSYTCTCNDGYVGDGTSCSDIDECTSFSSPHSCPENSECVNNVGSYRCTCEDGYTQSEISGDGSFTCDDVDECTLGYDNCDSNADCANTDGSFTCTCKNGYSGNGVTCSDIDECESSIPCTGTAEKCENRVGTYRCICQTDYYRQGENNVCSASSSRSLVVVMTLVEGLNPLLLFSDVNTQDNRDAVKEEINLVYNSSAISSTFLGASEVSVESVATGAQVTVRLDFTSDTTVTNAQIQTTLEDALGANNFLGSDNRFASINATNPVINPCEEGTHDCYTKNFEDCVFVSSGVFTCANCETGYLNETSNGADVCSEIFPCQDDPDICTDVNFIDCVHDSPGVYHCENCEDGYSLEGSDMCVVYKTMSGEFTMTSIQGASATYTADLADSSTSAFTSLATIVCAQVIAALEAQNETTVYSCEVTAFQSGSIIAVYHVKLDDTVTTASDSDIQSALVTYLTSGSSSLGVDSSSFTLVDICDSITCQNSGWCVPDNSYNPTCSCPSGYTGSTCGDLVTTASSMTTVGSSGSGSGGLSTGAIIGIAVGCSILIIVIIVILIIVIMKSKAGAKVSSADDDDDNREGYTNRGMELDEREDERRREERRREERLREEREREERQERLRREEESNNNQNNSNQTTPGQVVEEPENWRRIDVTSNRSDYNLRERVRDSPRVDEQY